MNAIVVSVNEHPASRLRAFSAAQYAATSHCSLHLVFGVANRSIKGFSIGADSFFVDSFDVADRVLSDLADELRRIVPTTCSAFVARPSIAAISEAKRIDASHIFGAETMMARRFNRRQDARRSALSTNPQQVTDELMSRKGSGFTGSLTLAEAGLQNR